MRLRKLKLTGLGCMISFERRSGERGLGLNPYQVNIDHFKGMDEYIFLKI